jgi:inorganic pyrophosphatase
MIDRGEADDKIVAVLEGDVTYGSLSDIHQCPPALVERLRHYFLTYKQSPGSGDPVVHIAEVYDRAEAEHVIELSVADYRDEFGAPEDRLRRLAAALRTVDSREG